MDFSACAVQLDVTHQLTHAHQVERVQGQRNEPTGRTRAGTTESGGQHQNPCRTQCNCTGDRRIADDTAVNEELFSDSHAGKHQRNRRAG